MDAPDRSAAAPKRTRKARPSHPRLGRCGLGVDGRAACAKLRGLSGRDCGQVQQGGVSHHEHRRPRVDPDSQRTMVEITGRSGIACSADSQGRQATRGGDGFKAGPLEGKRSAQASAMEAPRGETPSVARCAARQRGPAWPGDARIFVAPAMRFYSKPQNLKNTEPPPRICQEPQNRSSAKTTLCACTNPI